MNLDIEKERMEFLDFAPAPLPDYWCKRQEREFAVWCAAKDRATPLAPTPAAAEGQAEATCDQSIELAEELQKEWMRKSIDETRTAASLFDVGGFRAGMETACDEIETRMALEAAPLPAVAEGKAEALYLIQYDEHGKPPTVILGEEAARKVWWRVSHQYNAHLFVKLESNSKDCPYFGANYAAPLPRQAAVWGEDSARLDWLEQRGNDGGLLLHAGNQDTGGRSGLGLINTGRTLRQAVDSARGVKTAKSAPAPTVKASQ